MKAELILTPTGLLGFGRRIPVSIGRRGVTCAKREGDGATPAGLHRISGLFWRPDRLRRPAPWAEPIGPKDLWCDAPDHPLYNRHARAPFAASHECLRRADPLYDLIFTTDWNAAGHAGQGSAIFLHQWRRPGFRTAGCIAMSRANLIWLARRAAPGTRLFVSSVWKYSGARGSAPHSSV
ncbi:MAG: L,D-transpeptidase family protein [Paracoccus sp. (in: a-proteobacteria)]|nr:L,D-transpeptidase family protein [Paracoccus sp. (in: a-proteobacteria)]